MAFFSFSFFFEPMFFLWANVDCGFPVMECKQAIDSFYVNFIHYTHALVHWNWKYDRCHNEIIFFGQCYFVSIRTNAEGIDVVFGLLDPSIRNHTAKLAQYIPDTMDGEKFYIDTQVFCL